MNSNYLDEGYSLERGGFADEAKKVRNKIEIVFRDYCKDQVTPIDELITNLYQEDFDSFCGCAHACNNLTELYEICINKKMIEFLKSLGLKSPSINTRPLVSFSSPRTAKHFSYWKVPPHQDWPSTQGSINGITCWIPLVDVFDELGPLEVSPGSHLLGARDHLDENVPFIENCKEDFLPIPMRSGDALFFSTFLVHRSGNNTSNKIRLTVHFRYDDLSEQTFIERKYPRHRIDRRKEGILFPGFPTIEQIALIFGGTK